ncbi:MAG TPA: DNA recombination protein RmuC [Candidatus Binatia bacterium]|nr:DNA recombination protein RmuC [Candidatus Binatia bacterium]
MNSSALVLVAAGVVGAVVAWVIARAHAAAQRAESLTKAHADLAALSERLNARERDVAAAHAARAEIEGHLAQARGQIVELTARQSELTTTLEHERQVAAEKLAHVQQLSQQLTDSFKALSADALRSNNQSFIELAKATLETFQSQAKGDLEQRQKAVETLVAPIRESLQKVDAQISGLELARQQAYGALSQQVRSLAESQERLQAETGNLVKALRSPTVRGRWGEIQLKRVVEIAGMLAHCDFIEQETVTTADGRLRPDVVVKLPGGKNVVVDAKTPLQAYIEAFEAADDDTRSAKLKDHARQLRTHMDQLASKTYWAQFQPTPEFVVMFVPGDSFFSAALEQDPTLIEAGVSRRVLIATPITLIALLRAVAYGWTQEQLAANAERISDLGRQLYERVATLAGHFEDLRKALQRSVESFNSAVGSFESRVLVSARRFKELGAGSGPDIEPPRMIESAPRVLQAPEEQAMLPLPSASEKA